MACALCERDTHWAATVKECDLYVERDKLRAEVEVQRNDKELFEKRWCDEVDAHEKTKLQVEELPFVVEGASQAVFDDPLDYKPVARFRYLQDAKGYMNWVRACNAEAALVDQTQVRLRESDSRVEEPERENEPIGLCSRCQAPVYTTEGFCGMCGPGRA